VGWIVGFVLQDFKYTLFSVGLGTLLALAVRIAEKRGGDKKIGNRLKTKTRRNSKKLEETRRNEKKREETRRNEKKMREMR
jgi:hypothetical protein